MARPVTFPLKPKMRYFERGSILRCFFALLTIHTWFCGMFEPRSLHFMVTQAAGVLGVAVITAFGILGFVALVDSVVNDFMPKGFTLPSVLKYRHLIFMAIAILNATEMFVTLQFLQSWGLTLYCLLVATFVTITAFRDINHRFTGHLHA